MQKHSRTGNKRYFSLVYRLQMRNAFLLVTLTAAVLLTHSMAGAQGYQALHGSSFTGSTSVFNNPASIAHAVHRWELTLLSVQAKSSTNASYLQNENGQRYLSMYDGYRSRFVHANMDASLLNFMYKIDEKQAVAVNFRIRNYVHSKALPFNYVDSTVHSMNDFLIANRTTPFLEGFATTAGWAEADFSYARVLSRTPRSQLSGGITLQVMKNISGGFARLNKFSFLEQKSGSDTAYTFTNGSGSFAYSQSLDAETPKEAWKQSPLSLGLSLGIEYLIYDDEDEKGPLNYSWKIGASLMDLGSHSFTPSSNSRLFSDPKQNITDADADNKISGAADAEGMADSIATLFNNTSVITERFAISQPTRFVLNIDKRISGNFYVNGDLSMNFYSTSSYTKLRIRELNMLTITPRWETMVLGAYLPVQYNTQGQLWIGAALKLGPLTFGVHDLGLLLKKTPRPNGGGYLLLSIHPFSKAKEITRFDCR